MRFLVTGIGGPAGVALTNQLLPLGHIVCGVDIAPIENPKLSSFATVPDATAPNMIDTLLTIIDAHEIDVVIPTVSDELALVSAHKGQFGATPVVIGEPDAVATAHDKYLTMERLHSHGVPVPRFALPSEFDSATAALAAFGGVFAFKPRVGRGGRGFRVVSDASEVDWGDVDDSMILQEFAPGTEYCPNMYAKSPDDSLVVVLEKRPDSIVRSNDAPEVARVARQTVAAMGLVGPVDIDMRLNSHNTPVVLEVNARFGANSELAPEVLQALLSDLGPRLRGA